MISKALLVVTFSLSLLGPAWVQARAQAKTGAATKTMAVADPSGFELCFSAQHGRCFQTVATDSKDGKLRLRQFGGLSDSEATVTSDQISSLRKEVAGFYSSTKYAKPLKTRLCTRPLVFKTPAHETRCLEKLKPKDSDKLLSLVSKISLASKP